MSLRKHEVTITLNGNGVKVIFDLLAEAHQNWSGGDPAEQELLYILKNGFYRAYMDCVLELEAEE